MRLNVAVVLLLLVAGCRSATEPVVALEAAGGPELLAGEWRLVKQHSGSLATPPLTTFTLRFLREGRIGGMAGPNGFGGLYTATEDGEIAVSELVTTLIGGPDAERGGEYLDRVGRSTHFEVSGTDLRLYDTGSGHLQFQRLETPRTGGD